MAKFVIRHLNECLMLISNVFTMFINEIVLFWNCSYEEIFPHIFHSENHSLDFLRFQVQSSCLEDKTKAS